MNILCAGVAHGVVKASEEAFFEATGARLAGRFGSVGVLKRALLAGESCDVMIATAAMVAALQQEGQLVAGSEAVLGCVRTGLAVPEGEALPDISTPDALKARLLAASAIYFPDAQMSTSGIHFATVLARLGIAEQVSGRLHTFPSAVTVMCELAAAPQLGAIGCTQVTEIKDTPGVVLVGALPKEFDLVTVYTAAVTMTAAEPSLARRFVEWISGPQSRALRQQVGFELTQEGRS